MSEGAAWRQPLVPYPSFGHMLLTSGVWGSTPSAYVARSLSSLRLELPITSLLMRRTLPSFDLYILECVLRI